MAEDFQECHGCRTKLPHALFSKKQLNNREQPRCRVCTSTANSEYEKVFACFEEMKKFRPRLSKKKIRRSWKIVRRSMETFARNEFRLIAGRDISNYSKTFATQKIDWKLLSRRTKRMSHMMPVKGLSRSEIEYSCFYCPHCDMLGRSQLDAALESLTFPQQIVITYKSGHIVNGVYVPVEDRSPANYKEFRQKGKGTRIVQVDGIWTLLSQTGRILAESRSEGSIIYGTALRYPPDDGWRVKLPGTDTFVIDPSLHVENLPKKLNPKCEHIYVGDLEAFMNEQLRRMGSLSAETDIIVNEICGFLQPSSLLYISFKDLLLISKPQEMKTVLKIREKKSSDDGW